MFGSSLAAKTKLRGLVDILCAASEFDSLPVRHSEEKLLFRLAKHLPLAIDSNRLTDPHTKANVLIQSHFMNRRLIADFREDLHLVLPLATRLLNAMVDVLSSEGECSDSILGCLFVLASLIRCISRSPTLLHLLVS